MIRRSLPETNHDLTVYLRNTHYPTAQDIMLSFTNIKFQKCVINMKTLRNLITTHTAPFLGTAVTYFLKCFKIYGPSSKKVSFLAGKFRLTRNIYLPAYIPHIYVSPPPIQ